MGKEAAKGLLNVGKEQGEKLAAQEGSATSFVGKLEGCDGDAKAVGAAMEVMVKKCPNACMLVVSSGSARLMVQAAAPKGGKVSAKAWVEKALQAAGGKGGGSDVKAQGQATDVSKVDATL